MGLYAYTASPYAAMRARPMPPAMGRYAQPQPPLQTAYPAHSQYPQQAWSSVAQSALYPRFQTQRSSSLPVTGVAPVTRAPAVPFENHLKSLFQSRQAITYALNLRTFAAQDKNADGKIDPTLGENGTFLKAIALLPELKALGVNNIHMLPCLEIGETDHMGGSINAPGSLYSPAALDRLNPEFKELGSPYTLIQEARMFVDAAHRLGIHIMMDIPSSASVDLAKERPDLMAHDSQGNPLTPTDWFDIRMFAKDSPALRDYYQKYFNLMVNQLGVDGFRVDIARARTPEFWEHFIGQYPDKAWLAEMYTKEDASPMRNIPPDDPERYLKAGFDAFYGQFNIFQSMSANDYIDYLKQNQALFQRIGPQKAVLGSFLTHDDHSAMQQGGELYCKLMYGLMASQPDTLPYILDGSLTGYKDDVFDIFNWRPRPVGKYPDIGVFAKKMFDIRRSADYGPILTQGSFVPLDVKQSERDPRVIAFLRQYQGRTVLVLANKDVNASHHAVIKLPGFNLNSHIHNLAPTYGERSDFQASPNALTVNLARGRFYLLDITPPQAMAPNNTTNNPFAVPPNQPTAYVH